MADGSTIRTRHLTLPLRRPLDGSVLHVLNTGQDSLAVPALGARGLFVDTLGFENTTRCANCPHLVGGGIVRVPGWPRPTVIRHGAGVFLDKKITVSEEEGRCEMLSERE